MTDEKPNNPCRGTTTPQRSLSFLGRGRWALVLALIIFAGAIWYSPAATDDHPGDVPATDAMPSDGQAGISMSLPAEPRSLDPHTNLGSATRPVLDLLYGRLTYIGPDGYPKPYLAESWEFTDDGHTLVFTLRRGLSFHDGSALDSEAVIFSLERLLSLWSEGGARLMFGSMSGIEALDSRRVALYFEDPHAPILFNLASVHAAILPPAVVRMRGEDFGTRPVGSGPMRFDQWIPGEEIRLVRNRHYAGGRVPVDDGETWALDSISFVPLPEADARIDALGRGNVHLVPTTRSGELEDDFEILRRPDANNLTLLEFDHGSAPFDDLRLRRAVSLAVDRDALVAAALDGNATPNATPLPSGSWGFAEEGLEDASSSYDPDAARRLILEAGYSPGDDGGLKDADGTPLEITLWVHSTPTTIRAAEVLAGQLEEVGFDVRWEVLEFSTMMARLPEGVHDLSMTRWTSAEPSFLSMLFRSPGWSGLYSNEGVDSLLDAMDGSIDREARRELALEVQTLLLEDVALVPLYTDWPSWAHRPELRGVTLDRSGNPLFHGAYVSE